MFLKKSFNDRACPYHVIHFSPAKIVEFEIEKRIINNIKKSTGYSM